MKIWHRFFFKHLLNNFLFILISILIGYVLVDLSVNGVRYFSGESTTLTRAILYYLKQISNHLELFFPLSFLLASMKVLSDINSHQIIALQMAGLSKKKLLSPFFIFAGILSLISYGNSQWFSPQSQDEAYQLRDKSKKTKNEKVSSLVLDDDSELIYQSFNPETQELFDVFWVVSADDIWHMKTLKPPIGRFVDHLTRGSDKQFEKRESFDEKQLPELVWKEDASPQKFIPYENRSLTDLIRQAGSDSADRQSILTHLHYKMARPLLPFLVLLSIGPISMRFSRHRPTFLIAACSLFGFIALMTILDGMLILGENQVLPSFLVIWTPMAIALASAARPFAKL